MRRSRRLLLGNVREWCYGYDPHGNLDPVSR